MQKQHNSRRSGNVADRRVQYALIRRILFHWCVFMVAACFVGVVLRALLGDHDGTWSSFLTCYWRDQAPFLVVTLFLLPIFLVDTNKFSHKFAGPMIRFRRSMREVANGQIVPEIKFRPGDFWHDIATDFNAVLKNLENNLVKSHKVKESNLTGDPVSSDVK